jgi:hypothetical protein
VANDRVVGVLTVDDLVVDLTDDLRRLTRPINAQVLFGHREPVAPTAPACDARGALGPASEPFRSGSEGPAE